MVLGTLVTPELIENEGPDVLHLAMGAEPLRPPIERIDLPHVISVSDADLRAVPIGQRVVVCGAGLSGSECALELAREGKQVALVDRLPREELCLEAFEPIRIQLMKMLDESSIDIHYGNKVNKITPGGVEIADGAGTARLLQADTVVTAFGLAPNVEAIEQLSGIVPETHVIGDSNRVGTIATANTDGFNVSVEL